MIIYKKISLLLIILAIAVSGCSNDDHTKKNQDSDNREPDRVEESGTELGLTESYESVRNGARLILTYDAKNNSFTGTVENTTSKTLRRVRVEVHLSNGIELGPTTPLDLDPGEKTNVKLTATDKDFKGWTAHPEVGSEEHGHGEGEGEHEREGRSEHNEEHEESHTD